MDSKELIESFAYFQKSGIAHPFTCKYDSKHDLLEAKLQPDGSVALECPTCGSSQTDFDFSLTIEDIKQSEGIIRQMFEKATERKLQEQEATKIKRKSYRLKVEFEIELVAEVDPRNFDEEDEIPSIEDVINYEVDTYQNYQEDLNYLIQDNLHLAKVTKLE